jgi:hypothetical protein
VTLEAPHMHVIREDGVHIITLEISEEAAPASGGMFFRDPPAGQEPAEKSPKPALQL